MVNKDRTSFEVQQIIIFNYEKGLSVGTIGEMLGGSNSTVADVIRRYKIEYRVELKVSTGRPRI